MDLFDIIIDLVININKRYTSNSRKISISQSFRNNNNEKTVKIVNTLRIVYT